MAVSVGSSAYFPEIIPIPSLDLSSLDQNPYIFDQNELLDRAQIELDTFGRVILTIIALIKDILFNIQIRFHRFFYERDAYIDSGDLETERSDSSPALCLMLHGLKATSFGFDALHDAILEDASLSHLRVYRPIIEEKGDCSLEKASLSIARKVATWALLNPLKPIFLIGTSNGGRVIGEVAASLAENPDIRNPLRAFCIASPFYGTQLLGSEADRDVSLGTSIWQHLVNSSVASMVFEPVVFEELSYGAEKAKQVVTRVQQAARRGVDFTFYATIVDPLVFPFSVSIPKGVVRATAFLIEAEGHSSIVHAIQDHLIAMVKEYQSAISRG